MPGWALAQGAELTDPAAVAERFDFLAGERLAALIHGAAEAPGAELLSPQRPTFSDMLVRAIDHLFHVENLEDRFAVCLFFLKDDALGYRQKEAMVELLGVVKQLMHPDRRMDVDKILSRLTDFFRDRDNQFLLMRFKCYEAIGVAIGEASNVKAVDHVVEDVLSWRFQYPDIRGATDEWATVVNPYHLPKIRCWMHIIESNPALYERLAAALNVQLRLGGVLHRRHRPLPARRHPVPERRHPPHLLRRQAAPAHAARCTSTKSAPRASCARSPPRSTRSAGGATPCCTFCASSSTRSRRTGWWLQPRRAALLD